MQHYAAASGRVVSGCALMAVALCPHWPSSYEQHAVHPIFPFTPCLFVRFVLVRAPFTILPTAVRCTHQDHLRKLSARTLSV